MNEQERIELLRKVAEVAPKEMDARLYKDWDVEFRGVRTKGDESVLLWLDEAQDLDAQAVFAMLDAMNDVAHSKCGWAVSYCRGWYHVDEVSERNPDYIGKRIASGDSYAEAVARAFVEVFSK